MSYLLVACPKCHAAYKIPRERALTDVTCRACSHTWVPSHASPAHTDPPPAAPSQATSSQPVAPPPSSIASTIVAAALPDATDAPLVLADPTPAPHRAAARPTPTQSLTRAADVAAAARIKPPGPPPPTSQNSSAGPPTPAKLPSAAAPPLAAKPPSHAGNTQEMAEVVRQERPDALVGTTINGFKIQERIGSGGFGVVYRAFDTNLERSVAIKMLPPKLAKAGQGLMDRFLREARSAAKLAHANIVTIHQICAYKETFYIVMELIDGGALHERLQAQPQKHYQPVEATRIVRAAAEGIGHAHRRGIIHRDIKPGNIMMTNDGQVKVSDFGLARDVLQGRDIVGEGHCLGTPRYMSPEQALGEQPTAASDLYSLAATYYALVTGRAPFDGDNDRVIMKKQVTAAVPDPRLLVPTLPIALFRFFEKAMAKEPEDRYQTADEFIAALDRLDFGQTDTGSLSAQSLAAQIGPIALEDRTTHLTETLDRAVHRAQRQQRTPMTGDSVLDGSGSMSVNMSMSRDSGGVSPKVWIAIAVGLVVLLAAAIIAAVLLARSGTSPAASSKGTSSAAALPPAPPVATPTAAAPVVTPTPAATPSAAAAITPTVSPPVVTPTRTTPGGVPTPTSKPAPAKSAAKPSPTRKPGGPPTAELEQLARDALNGVKEEESNPHYSKDDIIRMYEDNVLSIKDYKGTKAAKEAEAAVKRLRVEDTPKAPPTP